jgi:hypothetical protein
MSTCLKRLVAKEPTILLSGRSRFNNELNDMLAEYRLERFLVAAPFESPRFLASLSQGKVTREDISQVQYFLSERLGFGETTTQWIADVWAGTFELQAFPKPGKFACPNCHREGFCKTTWRDRLVLCPSCNATIHISHSFNTTLAKAGWPKKRIKGKDWVILPTQFYKDISGIKQAILQLIENENLSVKDLADYLALPTIVNALRDEIAIILNNELMSGRKCQIAVVEGVTEVIFGKSAFAQTGRNQDLDSDVLSSLMLEDSETIIHMINACGDTDFPFLAFSSCAIHFKSKESYLKIPYGELPYLEITRTEAVTDFRIGSSRKISTKGLGINRRSAILAISIIQKYIQAFKQERF